MVFVVRCAMLHALCLLCAVRRVLAVRGLSVWVGAVCLLCVVCACSLLAVRCCCSLCVVRWSSLLCVAGRCSLFVG